MNFSSLKKERIFFKEYTFENCRWGHNHRGQLGGVDGAKVKLPTPCETLSVLRPVQVTILDFHIDEP